MSVSYLIIRHPGVCRILRIQLDWVIENANIRDET